MNKKKPNIFDGYAGYDGRGGYHGLGGHGGDQVTLPRDPKFMTCDISKVATRSVEPGKTPVLT